MGKGSEKAGPSQYPRYGGFHPCTDDGKGGKAFEEFNVFTRAELESRAEIEYETYAKIINIEARTMIDMASKQFIPAVIQYVTKLAKSLTAVLAACPEADVSVQREMITEASDLLRATKEALARLIELDDLACTMEQGREQALFITARLSPPWKPCVPRWIAWR